jgi:hypothetical protein
MYVLKRGEVMGKKRNLSRYFHVGVFGKRTHISCCGSVSVKMGSAKGF